MKLNAFSLIFFSLLWVSTQAQTNYTLSGTVSNSQSNEKLIGVTIQVKDQRSGVVTNLYGFYSITLPQGTYEIQVSSIGFKSISQSITLDQDKTINFQLDESAEELDELVITDAGDAIRKPNMSTATISVEKIKEIPMVMGEADVVKSLILLPGITNAGESSSGFNVRGGAADQNLVLLDEASIFNSSHLFGFFSVFNPDAIKNVTLYKGGIPSRYGGRVSSILEIFQRDGNSKTTEISGGIGTVASRALIEGPIIQDQTSYLIGVRGSYAHLFLPIFDVGNAASFYDFNAKVSHRVDDDNQFYLSTYIGQDYFSIKNNFRNRYGNQVMNFRWNHLFSPKLFSNLSFIYSKYNSSLEIDGAGFIWDSRIKNYNTKYGLSYFMNDRVQINFGMNNAYYIFNPGSIEPTTKDSGIEDNNLTKKTALESAIYLDVEQEVTPKFSVNYGMRYSYFIRLGQKALYQYEYDDPLYFDPFLLIYEPAQPISRIRYNRWGKLATFGNFEPRVSAAYAFNQNNSVKVSYTRMAQYLHLLSNTNSPTPVDVWTPSGPYVKPQLADQYAVGYFKNFSKRKYTASIESFYKKVQNRIDYVDGADLIANEVIETVILNGKARSYGLEFLLEKNNGAFTGWISYTLSKSEQRTKGRIPKFDNGRSNKETGINLGKWYSTPYDKRHDVAVVGIYKFNRSWSLSGNFVYQTGQPTNYPIGQFEFQGLTIPYYGPRNKQRLPDYHRFDLAATFTPSSNTDKRVKSEWIFSIYNVYNRQNAAAINFRQNQTTGDNEAIQTSIFGIVPSVTYNFKF